MQVIEPSIRLFSNMVYLWCFIPVILFILFLIIKNKGIEPKLKTVIRLFLLFCLVINIGMAIFGTYQYFAHPPIQYNTTTIKGNFDSIEIAAIQKTKVVTINTPQFFLNPGESLRARMLEIQTPDQKIYISENAYPDMRKLYGHIQDQLSKE